MDSIEDLKVVNVLDNIIINAINTIRKNQKRPDETLIYEFINKNLKNANLTKVTINERLTFMSKNNRITYKLTNGKNSYFVTNNQSSEPKEDIEKQLLIDYKRLHQKTKKTQLQIYRISWKTYRTSSSMNFRT